MLILEVVGFNDGMFIVTQMIHGGTRFHDPLCAHALPHIKFYKSYSNLCSV